MANLATQWLLGLKKSLNQGLIIGKAKEAVISGLSFWEFRIVLVKSLVFSLEAYVISSEASRMFVKIKQNLCANVPKGDSQQVWCVDKEQFKIKWLQTIHNVKWTFTQKQIPEKIENETCFQRIMFLHSMCKMPLSESLSRAHLIYLFVSRHKVHSMNTHTLQNAGC